jgi:hypothetical protein
VAEKFGDPVEVAFGVDLEHDVVGAVGSESGLAGFGDGDGAAEAVVEIGFGDAGDDVGVVEGARVVAPFLTGKAGVAV